MILYKYFSPNEYSFKSLAVKGLWCHYPKMMNDPFECLGLVKRSFSKENLESFREYIKITGDQLTKKLAALSDSKLEETINNHRAREIENFAFCALSEDYDTILLWSHYAKGHQGFVIGFEFPELDNSHHLRKVSYLNRLGDFDLIKWAQVLHGDETQQYHLVDDISVKSKDWAYENEWRIWRNKPGYYYFEPKQIKSVYLGINCDPETKSVLCSLTSYVSDDIMYYEMEFDEQNIKLKW